jgi:hypothetical protein
MEYPPKKQIVGLGGKPAVLKQAQQVVVLPVDVTWSYSKDVACQTHWTMRSSSRKTHGPPYRTL